MISERNLTGQRDRDAAVDQLQQLQGDYDSLEKEKEKLDAEIAKYVHVPIKLREFCVCLCTCPRSCLQLAGKQKGIASSSPDGQKNSVVSASGGVCLTLCMHSHTLQFSDQLKGVQWVDNIS